MKKPRFRNWRILATLGLLCQAIGGSIGPTIAFADEIDYPQSVTVGLDLAHQYAVEGTFSALIPIFGAFIGLGVGVFLMLVVNPMDAVIFTVVFFVLQQIEGNLIYPHVVGGSVGLPSIWVLTAVTVGGSVMGVAGMLLFIPLCSVFYALLREDVYSRITKETES